MSLFKNLLKLPVDVIKDVATGGLYNTGKAMNGKEVKTPFATIDRLIKIAEDTD